MPDKTHPIYPLHITEFMGRSRCLLVSLHTSIRSNVRKLHTDLGGKPHLIDVGETVADSWKFFEQHKHNIVFSDDPLEDGSSALVFLEKVKTLQPDRLQNVFILFSDNSSLAMATRAAEAEADAMIIKPFSFNSMHDHVLEILKSKILEEQQAPVINQISQCIDSGKEADALKLLDSIPEDKRTALLYFFKGKAYEKMKDYRSAGDAYQQGITKNFTHYKCNVALLELFIQQRKHEEAYQLAQKIGKDYPPTPRRIPTLIHLAVVRGQYEEVTQFHELYSKFDVVDPNVKNALAAGMVVAAKHLFKEKQPEKARDYLMKAEKVGDINAEVLKEIVSLWFRMGALQEAQDLLARVPPSLPDAALVRVGELEYLDSTGAPEVVLQLASELLNKNVEDVKLYKIAIRRYVEAGKDPKIIQDLIDKASKQFPDRKAVFEGLLPKTK